MSKKRKSNKFSEKEQLVRRQIILKAALECFFQKGYAKVSLDDIAKKAELSRPLIYLQFKNKKEILIESLRDLFMSHTAKAHLFLELDTGKKEKMISILEEIIVKIWSRLVKSPNGKEFLEECWQVCPQLAEDYNRETSSLLTPIFEDGKKLELFLLCVEGLCSDRPTTAILRRRIKLLVDYFFGD
jgi:TetR/AcrR family transcriptional regulator, transcriptional repressor of aconitase